MEFCVLKKSKVEPTRKYDVHYDKTIAVPGAKDYYRIANKAISSGTEYTLCPLFNTMFSDVRPRHCMKIKTYGREPPLFEEWRETQQGVAGIPVQPVDVKGFHRAVFFRQPIYPYMHPPPTMMARLQTTHISTQTMPSGDGLYPQPKAVTLKSIIRKTRQSVVVPPPTGDAAVASKYTQTDYRDSEAQTLPWAHDFLCMHDDNSQLLDMNWFKLGENVPPGDHEVTLIERAKQKDAWDGAFPLVIDNTTDKQRKSLVAMTETNDTAFRESELDAVHQLRIVMSEDKMRGDYKNLMVQMRGRLERLRNWKNENSEKKLGYMKHQFLRAMRKLHLDHNKINMKYHKKDIVSLHLDKTSELYAPQLRFGENPARRHHVNDIQCRFLKRFRGLEMLEERTTQAQSPGTKKITFDYNEASKPKSVGMCARATTLTEEGLQSLHSQLKAKRSKLKAKEEPPALSLRESLPSPGSLSPAVSQDMEVKNHQEESLQASLVLSKVIKGRALQTRLLSGFLEIHKIADTTRTIDQEEEGKGGEDD